MSSREGLRIARAMRQQLQDLQAGRPAHSVHAASAALRRWLLSRNAAEEQLLPPDLHSVLEEVVQLLADVAAALEPAASGSTPGGFGLMMAVSACCDLLGTLLMLCEMGLQLTERDALRLLAAGALPLHVKLDAVSADERAALFGSCCCAVHALLDLSSPETPLPPRAVAAALRSTLRPQALASWLNHAMVVFISTGADNTWDALQARDFVGAAYAACSVQGVPALVQSLVQEALVRVAMSMISIAAEPAHLAEGAPIVRPSFGLPVVLPVGRLQHEQNSGAALLAAVAGSLAARLQAAAQQQQRSVSENMPRVVQLHMALVAAVIKDASSADAAGRPAHPALLQAAVGALPRVLAALHRLSDVVDAASAAAGLGDGSSSGSGDGGGMSGSSGGREAEVAAATGRFAESLLQDPEAAEEVFGDSLEGFVDALAHLEALDNSMGVWASSELCTAAVATTDLVMRLLPRLGRWPVVVKSQGRPSRIAAAFAAAEPASAGTRSLLQRNPPQVLAFVLCRLSFDLCAKTANSREVGGEGAALAAFHAAMAACKWEHWLAGQQGADAFFLAELEGLHRPFPMHPACLAAQRLWQGVCWAVRDSSDGGERKAQAQRRLDCILLTYIEALTARPAAMPQTDVVQARMLALSAWFNWPPEAAGTDLLLADSCRGACMLMQTVADALAEDEASCPSAIAIGTLQFVLEHSQPSLLPVAAATPDLLRQLAALAGRPRVLGTTIPELNRPAKPTLASIMRLLLQWLQRCAREQQAAVSSSSSGSSPAVDKLLKADVDAATLPEMGRLLTLYSRSPLPEAALPLPQPEASPDDLALRRARALALRACANPRCTKLAEDSEAALKGRRCSGCRLVRYCCEACNKQDWQAHKRACRLLSAARAVGSS